MNAAEKQAALTVAPDNGQRETATVSVTPIQLGHNLVLACFLAVAWLTFWGVGTYAARRLEVRLGPTTVLFASRFPEKESYSIAQFENFVQEYPDRSRFYLFPVLFPLDIVVMLLLAASIGLASYYWTLHSLPVGWSWLACAAFILPTAYLVADLVEDAMLANALVEARVKPNRLAGMIAVLKKATRLKLFFIGCSVVETLLALVVYLFMTSCNWSYFDKACVDRPTPDLRIVLGLPSDLSFLDRSITRNP